MSKKELNDFNYIIAIINQNNMDPFTLDYNMYKKIIDQLDYKKLKFKIEKEKIENYSVIKIFTDHYIIQVEKNNNNLLKILCIQKIKGL